MALVFRLVKGLPLTFEEMDGNFEDLDGRATDLDIRTDEAELDISTLSANLVALNGTVSSQGSAISALTLRVDDAEDELAAHEGRLDAIELDIANLTANDVDYDNLASGLTATDVQDALDEIVVLVNNAGDVTLNTAQTLTAPKRSQFVAANSGSMDFATSAHFTVTPAGSITLQFTVGSGNAAGQSGFIKLYNPSGYAISIHSNFKVDADLTTLLSTAGNYLLSYLVESNTQANLVSSPALA